ncbi:hypothetical protein [Halomicronema sp. CCY15110]|uniref:hypothetical protein n=1 Tax=Halomicronema sp. CCY15110 TaxID=2767773 RepID=UPI0019512688|nr:hypothetical protein [Halomicronema sp. CCY15110]
MLEKHIISLLSQHRLPGAKHLPQAIAQHQVVRLLKDTLSPNQNNDLLAFAESVDIELHNLEAQGEILLGTGRRVCVAQPTLWVDAEEFITSLKLIGDRAYLSLIHQLLETGQDPGETLVRPRSHSLARIRDKLKGSGVSCLTIDQSLGNLPQPQVPSSWNLRGQEWLETPLSQPGESCKVYGYLPKWGSQRDRWQLIASQSHFLNLPRLNLLRVSGGVFLWAEQGQFFEITPDEAYLAMFHLDLQAQEPLRICWDEQSGLLDLRDTYLPKAFAQLIWRLSNPNSEHNRIRYVDAQNRPRVKAALERLGCVLV